MGEELLWAWAAGIIDGEGTITLGKNIHSRTPSYSLSLHVEMSSMTTIYKLRHIFGVGSLYDRKRDSHVKMYKVQVNGPEVPRVCQRLLPYLVTKLRQAKLAIEYHEKCSTARGNNKPVDHEIQLQRELYCEEFRELNKKGR